MGEAECAERLNSPYPTGVLACYESFGILVYTGACAFRRAHTFDRNRIDLGDFFGSGPQKSGKKWCLKTSVFSDCVQVVILVIF